MKDKIIKVLKQIKDPELGIDIYTMGFIYNVDILKNNVNIKMTFTSPMCPEIYNIVEEIKEKVGKLKGIKKVNVEVVFDPPWQPPEELKKAWGL